jgi:chitodextrinase
MERVAEYYYVTGDSTAKAILDNWVAWAISQTTVTSSSFQIPANLSWTGQPDTWNASSPGSNSGLHVTVASTGNDVGVAAAYVKTLCYYAAKSGSTTAQSTAKSLLDAMSTYADTIGIAVPETRTDYSNFNVSVYVPSGWTGKMPNGDPIQSGATFLSIRSWYKSDPQFAKVQAYLNGGAAPVFTYHRFWAQADIAMAYAVYGELFEGGSSGGDTTPPSTPTGVTVTGTTSSSVSLSWTASTDNVGVAGYQVYRGGTQVGTSASTTYTDTGLTAATQYSYTVTAYDAAGNVSPASTAVTATTASGSSGGGSGTVKVQYKNNDTNATDNQVKPDLQLVNTGSSPLTLSTVTMRYWFTGNGGATTFTTYVDYAALGSAAITQKVVQLTTPVTGADHYLEVGFTSAAGSLAAGASTGEIQNRFNKTDWSAFNQSNDYSYGTNTAFQDDSKVTVYVNGTLAWGNEP